MNGETDLSILLKALRPILNEGIYLFCSYGSSDEPKIPFDEILMYFRESEGMTLIISQQTAIKYNLSQENLFSWITLSVHSSLSAVGLTSAFSTALAKMSISCNVVSGYYHDHIFVSQEDAQRAMKVLLSLTV